MSTQMENTDAALAHSARLTRLARDDLGRQITALDGRLADVGRSWVGEGSAAFVRVTQAWDAQVRRLLDSLAEFGDSLEGVDRSFAATDADVTAGLEQLTARLG